MTFQEKLTYRALIIGGYIVGSFPIRVQYGIADFIAFVLYRLLKYRLNVIRINLRNSFPQKSVQERLIIEKAYYKHLGDMVLESITLIAISKKSIKERYVYKNIEQLSRHHTERTSFAVMGHFGCWEYAVNYAMYVDVPVMPVYNPLFSKPYDEYYKKARSKFGATPIPMKSTGREIVRNMDKHPAIALIGDQAPPINEKGYWVKFLNQETAFFNGMAKLSLKFGIPIEYMSIKMPKRGFYEVEFKPVYDGIEKVEEQDIIKRYVTLLEQDINRDPHLWLWSHRRWKNTIDGIDIYK